MSEKEENQEFALTIPDDFDAHIEGNKLIVGDEEYSLTKLKAEIERRADENAPATVSFSVGGTTIGAATFGPPGGVAGAVIGSGIGYLIDKGYLSPNEADDVEEVDIESVEEVESEVSEPEPVPEEENLPDIFHRHENRWYRPDSDLYKMTVRTPDGDRAYFETIEGARQRLQEEYE